MLRRSVGWLVVVVAGLLSLSHGASAALLRTQAPCSYKDPFVGYTYCISFSAGSPLPSSLRSIDFHVPRAGTALVSFTGSLVCFNASDRKVGVVDLVTEISSTLSGSISPADSGALRHAMTIGAPPAAGYSVSGFFNLASTRTFQFSAARDATFYMRLSSQLMTQYMNCDAYDATFSILFTP